MLGSGEKSFKIFTKILTFKLSRKVFKVLGKRLDPDPYKNDIDPDPYKNDIDPDPYKNDMDSKH